MVFNNEKLLNIRSMNIAWIGKRSPFCGNTVHSKEVIRRLEKRGYKVTFLHFFKNPLRIDNINELSFLYIEKMQAYTLISMWTPQVFFRTLYILSPNILHIALALSPLDFFLPEFSNKLNIPVIGTLHSAFSLEFNNTNAYTHYLLYKTYSNFIALYTKIIVFSTLQRRLLLSLGVPPHKLLILPNSVNYFKYLPGKSRLKQAVKTQCIFLFFGRIAIEKNLYSLLKAWRVSSIAKHGKLLIVGSGPLEDILMMDYKASHGIIWLGEVGDEFKRINILKNMQIVISSSDVEGLPLSLLEAMSCRLTCIFTNAGSNAEVISSYGGILIKTHETINCLKILFPFLLKRNGFWHIVSHKSREIVIRRYSLFKCVRKLENLYSEVLLQHVFVKYRFI
uniref:Glycosyltransferase n=1 Tax=Gronococcus sybilensis TaxID=3028029 RepID=A0A9Y1I2D8_9RHOD|nr:hypothetical protein GRSY_007 [Gronococcus sybilensis]